jgi:predicted cobalt transporter CbtA
MISSLLIFLLVGLIALVAISIVLSIVGAVFGLFFGLAGFLLFKVAPVVLLGYLIVRFLAPRRGRLTAADREWIES